MINLIILDKYKLCSFWLRNFLYPPIKSVAYARHTETGTCYKIRYKKDKTLLLSLEHSSLRRNANQKCKAKYYTTPGTQAYAYAISFVCAANGPQGQRGIKNMKYFVFEFLTAVATKRAFLFDIYGQPE
jgi:hypothetical protein